MSKHWPKKPLSEVISIQSGFAFKSDEYTESGHFLIRIGNVQDGYISLENPKYVALDKKTANFELKEGDILTSLTGNIGRVAEVRDTHLPAALNQRVARLSVKSELNLDKNYLLFFLLSDFFRISLSSGGHGAAQQNVSPSAIGDILVPLPPLAEQKRIVAILDEAFAGIAAATANAEKNLANARELFNGYLSSVFNSTSEKWPQKTIGEIAEHTLGKMLDKGKNRGSLQPYLRNLNVRWFEFDLDDVLEMRFEADEQERYTAIKDDVLICEGGYPGRAAIWQGDNPIYFQKALHRVRFEQEALGRWFVYFLYLSDATDELRQHFTGSGIQHLTGQALHKLRIPFPPLPTVEIYVERFDLLFEQTKKLEAIYRQKLSTLADLKQAILQKAFSGELTALPGAEMQEEAA